MTQGIFKIFKNHKGDLSQISPEPNVVTGQSHQTNKCFILKLISFNSRPLQISERPVKNKSVDGAVLITILKVLLSSK